MLNFNLLKISTNFSAHNKYTCPSTNSSEFSVFFINIINISFLIILLQVILQKKKLHIYYFSNSNLIFCLYIFVYITFKKKKHF